MIKFLRQIRRNLMETGKTSKYIKYAIGEIVLVVIGILIALQINNWNEQRKLNQNDLQLCKELLNDALADSIFFQSRRVRLKGMKSTAHYILEVPELRKTDSTILIIVEEADGFFKYSALRYLSNVVNNGKNNTQEFQAKSVINALRHYQLQYDYVAYSFQRMNTILENELNPFRKKFTQEFMNLKQTHDLNTLNTIYNDKELQKSVYLLDGYFDDALDKLTLFQNNNSELIHVLKEHIKKAE